ncbi:MAG: YjbH domain-containing protein [Gammaproteobacteria bacterium]|nr:YjbH domain-containing protein [Gammaproteobacteria bacterium]
MAIPLALTLVFGHGEEACAQGVPDLAPVRFDTMGDYGTVGLMQMPTARMAPDGQLSLGFSRVAPYNRFSVNMQALPWLETALRYTTIDTVMTVGTAGVQNKYQDRAFDVKLRLVEESRTLPEVALGFRDIGGTGLFSGEYLVANRRYYDWDFMVGIGWGYLGSRGQMRNPMRLLSSTFDTRKQNTGSGGTLQAGNYFSGEYVSVLAGVSYRTPIAGLTLKAELDGNNYQQEPLGQNQAVRSPINVGATYKINDWVDLSLAVERGNTAMFQMVLKENLKSSPGFPKHDPPPPEVRGAAPQVRAHSSRAADALAAEKYQERLSGKLDAAGFKLDTLSLDESGRRLTAYVSQNTWRNPARAAGRAARIIANEVPTAVDKITLANLEEGVETHRLSLYRRDLENASLGLASSEELWARAGSGAPLSGQDAETRKASNPGRYPAFDWSWAPALRQHIGGYDAAYAYQIYLGIGAELQLARGLSLSGSLSLNVHDTFSQFQQRSDSVLPHVRSDIAQYLREGPNSLSRLQADYITQFGPDWYGKVSGGIFEDMFAGYGGEALYRPYGRRWAIGANLYHVRQRDYDQRFSLRDYTATTGHVDVHYRLPFYQLQTTVSAGQYLAGDRGMTLEISRHFESGARIGVWATRTNVSAQQFGEGSFDKGIYISFPLDQVSLFSSRGMLNFSWRPISRDGGQKLITGKPLAGLVHGSDPDTLARDWPSLLR